MKIFQILAASLFFLFGASAAYAGGDLSDYTRPPADACGGPFSGFYGGGILGLGGLSSKVSSGGFSFNGNDRGFTIGGVGGYNWQCNGRLLGIETDISYFNADNCLLCDPVGSVESQTNWYGTLRGRVGLVGGENFLVFATGGLAYGGVDHSFRDALAPGGPFSQTDSDTELGWTAGGGIEYFIRDNWALRADALFVDFGSEDHTYVVANGPCGGPCVAKLSWDDSFWVARVGLTYFFNSPPEPAYTPLK